MKDALLTVGSIICIFIVLPLFILWLRDKVFHRPPTAEEMEEAAEEFKARRRSPDLESIEAHFGHPLPPPLRVLYSDQVEVMRCDFEVVPPDGSDSVYIDFYNPADKFNLHCQWPGAERYFAFANDGMDNDLVVDPLLDDPPVFDHDHETGELSLVAKSLTDFMAWERRAVEETDED